MRDFFHGWRRKAGCVTLVIACGFAGLWLRSLVVENDSLLVSDVFRNSIVEVGGIAGIASIPNSLVIWKRDPPISEEVVVPSGQQVMTLIISVSPLCEIPFWSLVLPLTLLSAWLILTRPRKREKPGGKG